MIAHVFNSTIVSGPETLVIPVLKQLEQPVELIFLVEKRRPEESKGPIEYGESFGLKCHQIEVEGRVDHKAIRKLAEHILLLDYELVHSHEVKASTYLKSARDLIAARSKKVPKIVSTHHGVRGRKGFKLKLYEWFYVKFILPHFDRILAVCSSDREILVERGLPAEKTLTHLNGVDRPKVTIKERPKKSEAIRKSWGVEKDAVYIGYVGRLSEEKRIDRTLEVVKILKAMGLNENWKLLLFGIGPLEKSLKKLALKLKVEDRILWMGYRKNLGSELAGVDILISMSDAEGLPINIVEAGWSATPVVATHVDGVRDLIPSKEYGRSLEIDLPNEKFSEALKELITQPSLRQKLGERFQHRVIERFSGAQWLENLKKIYRDLGV